MWRRRDSGLFSAVRRHGEPSKVPCPSDAGTKLSRLIRMLRSAMFEKISSVLPFPLSSVPFDASLIYPRFLFGRFRPSCLVAATLASRAQS
jgi:hypothetical protein